MLLMWKLLTISILLSSFLYGVDNQTKKIALIISNSNYKSFSPLNIPSVNSSLLLQSLVKRNYKVIDMKDISNSFLSQKIDQIVKEVANETTLFIYFSGYMLNKKGENFLIAYDSNIIDLNDVSEEAISLSKILKKFKKSKNIFIILNAYGVKSVKQDNSNKLAPLYYKNVHVISSSEFGKVMNSDYQKSENFTQSIIKDLDSNVSLESLFERRTNKGDILVRKYIQENFAQNKDINIEIIKRIELEKMYMWYAYIVDITSYTSNHLSVKKREVYFSDGRMVIKNLLNPETGRPYCETIFTLPQEYYIKRNLLYGHVEAKHKVVIFSDPMCPTCRKLVPPALKYMKKYPNKYALYYYHLPVVSVHPASVILAKANLVARKQGFENIALNLYTLDISPLEKDENIILTVFNKRFGTKITPKDIHTKEIENMYKEDIALEKALKIRFTPTFYIDGKIDYSKELYKTLK